MDYYFITNEINNRIKQLVIKGIEYKEQICIEENIKTLNELRKAYNELEIELYKLYDLRRAIR